MARGTGTVVLTVTVAAFLAGCTFGPNRSAGVQHFVRGKLLAEHGAFDAALAELAQAVKDNPSLGIAFATAGDIHRQRGDHELARRSYESACQANPYAFRPQYHLGLTYQTLARASKAADAIREYLRRAVKVYLRANMLEPQDFETNLNLSACYFQLRKFDLAEQYCKAALAIRPDDPHAHSNLGIIYDSENRLYDAIREYKASLEIDTKQPKLLMNLGGTYIRQGRLQRAIGAFKLAAEADPTDAVAWEQIGSCHYRKQQYDLAQDAYEKAVSLDSRSHKAYRGIGVVHMTRFILDQDRTDSRDKALAAWHTSLELKPDQEDLLRFVEKYTPKYTGPEL